MTGCWFLRRVRRTAEPTGTCQVQELIGPSASCSALFEVSGHLNIAVGTYVGYDIPSNHLPEEVMRYAIRVRAGIAVIVFFGLSSSFLMLRGARRELNSATPGRDPMTLFATRLEGIRRGLPPYGVVGYITDPPNDINQELIWTRYYLAPLLVLPSSQRHQVIGNFHKPVSAEFLSEQHLVLIKDYGDGMMLFTNQKE